MISIENLNVALGSRAVIRDINATIPSAKVTAIVGPNGCGKTTLMRTLSGELAYTGRICFDGKDLSQIATHERAELRAVLPQRVNVTFPFTVREIVTIAQPYGHRAGEEQVQAALQAVDLEGFEGRRFGHLSGGEQQRVQIARVLLHLRSTSAQTPGWLFMDEPVASLDLRHQLLIMDIARDAASTGHGVVLVMHDLNLSAFNADHLIIMKEGHILNQGHPATIMIGPLLSKAFDCPVHVSQTPSPDMPFVLPVR